MIAALAILLPLILIAWFVTTVRFIGHVSKGPRRPAGDRTALILVDLQSCFWDDGPYDDETRSRVTQAVTALIQSAKEQNQPIIALRQEWSTPSTKLLCRLTMGGKAIAGTSGTQMAAAFAGVADHEIVKRVQDGFETKALDDLLHQLGVGHLIIAGLDGMYCVNKTSQAALARGYHVTIQTEAVATAQTKAFGAVLAKLKANGAEII